MKRTRDATHSLDNSPDKEKPANKSVKLESCVNVEALYQMSALSVIGAHTGSTEVAQILKKTN